MFMKRFDGDNCKTLGQIGSIVANNIDAPMSPPSTGFSLEVTKRKSSPIYLKSNNQDDKNLGQCSAQNCVMA